MTQRSNSFAYGTRSIINSDIAPVVYPALVSRVAQELRKLISITDHVKNGIDYKNTFDGKEVVDKITTILYTKDRNLAIKVGRSLASQRIFHDVCYETQLEDSSEHLYEFSNAVYQLNTNDSLSEIESVNNEPLDLPNSVLTELTYCYSPTCWGNKPCYSPTCPKRLTQKRLLSLNNHFLSPLPLSFSLKNEVQGYHRSENRSSHHDRLWANRINKELYLSIPKIERKRQENIFELIYTEQDYVESLNYLETMWIEPLKTSTILPTSKRESLVKKIFRNISTLIKINSQLLKALKTRQKVSPVIDQIGDVLLDHVGQFEPYIHYGSKQHEAKFILENEIHANPAFDAFVQSTERHPSSLKLELNGYLTKPTTRLGRYTLLLTEILKHTPEGHPDQIFLPKALQILKQCLSLVNYETGKAKTRFDLERIHYNLSFKYKADEANLDLLDKKRLIIKQGTLKKSAQPESVDYLVLLLDHCLIVTKLKVAQGPTEKYVIQKRPIPIELLSAYVPRYDPSIHSKLSSSLILPYLTNNNPNNTMMIASSGGAGIHVRASTDLSAYLSEDSCYPLTFKHLGRSELQFTLYASSAAVRKAWIEKIKRHQEEYHQKKQIFEPISVFPKQEFLESNRLYHFITFNGGQQYLMAAEDGIYVGHHNYKSCPHKVLSLQGVTHIQAIESTQILLVLMDRHLWQYPLDVVNGKPENQPMGHLIQTQVPFFYVGYCLQKTMICVPKVSAFHSVISTFEPVDTNLVQITSSKRGSLIPKFLKPSNLINLRKLKDCYVPCEAYAVELSATMMLITTSRGVIMIDMKTDQPQQLLNPSDKNLSFIVEREKEPIQLRQPMKHIAIFRTPRNHYFLCYDEYAFYIDSKGNRLFKKFLIEWEGVPDSFAFSYPFVVAFHATFIEVRNVFTGTIEQILSGKQMTCLNNGHKTELSLIFGSMLDPKNEKRRVVFQLRPNGHTLDTLSEPSTHSIKK
ncbi:hypothetical protein BY458DRAFT_428538 [Sporodiniella umbellata]|nr:hypothetical protein BY458DRAFT_428538 [Sporodiniella umbellata]